MNERESRFVPHFKDVGELGRLGTCAGEACPSFVVLDARVAAAGACAASGGETRVVVEPGEVCAPWVAWDRARLVQQAEVARVQCRRAQLSRDGYREQLTAAAAALGAARAGRP